MIKNIFFGFCGLLVLVGCASEVVRLKETEYLRTQPGKPVIYPQGVDKPQQEKTYVIPDLPKSVPVTTPEPPEALALPPRLIGVDAAEDEEGEDENEDEVDKESAKPVGGVIDSE